MEKNQNVPLWKMGVIFAVIFFLLETLFSVIRGEYSLYELLFKNLISTVIAGGLYIVFMSFLKNKKKE